MGVVVVVVIVAETILSWELFDHCSLQLYTCLCLWHIRSHTHTFNGPLSGTTMVSRYQEGKTNLDFTEARDSEWQWHPLGHMQACTSLQSDNHASTPPLSFFTGRMPFLPPNQQRQSTEGTSTITAVIITILTITVIQLQHVIIVITWKDTKTYLNHYNSSRLKYRPEVVHSDIYK